MVKRIIYKWTWFWKVITRKPHKTNEVEDITDTREFKDVCNSLTCNVIMGSQQDINYAYEKVLDYLNIPIDSPMVSEMGIAVRKSFDSNRGEYERERDVITSTIAQCYKKFQKGVNNE